MNVRPLGAVKGRPRRARAPVSCRGNPSRARRVPGSRTLSSWASVLHRVRITETIRGLPVEIGRLRMPTSRARPGRRRARSSRSRSSIPRYNASAWCAPADRTNAHARTRARARCRLGVSSAAARPPRSRFPTPPRPGSRPVSAMRERGSARTLSQRLRPRSRGTPRSWPARCIPSRHPLSSHPPFPRNRFPFRWLSDLQNPLAVAEIPAAIHVALYARREDDCGERDTSLPRLWRGATRDDAFGCMRLLLFMHALRDPAPAQTR